MPGKLKYDEIPIASIEVSPANVRKTGAEEGLDELAQSIKDVVEYEGKIVFDPTKPDGTPRKLIDCTKIHRMGWNHKMELYEGLAIAYKDFKARLEKGEIQ